MRFRLKTPRFVRGRRFKKLLIALIIILVIAIPLYLFIRNLNSPSYGQIKPVLPSQTRIVSDASYSNLSTQYFSLNYLDAYKLQVNPKLTDGQLDHKLLVKTLKPPASGTATMDIFIKPLKPGDLVIDKAYTQYQSDPKNWAMSRKFYQTEPVDLATRISGGNERGALWVHGNYLLSIRLSSMDPKQDLATELKDMLTSLQWTAGI